MMGKMYQLFDRHYQLRKKYWGQHVWLRGPFVGAVGWMKGAFASTFNGKVARMQMKVL